MKVKYIPLFFSLLLMISCEKEIEFGRSETEPIVVLNGVLITDSTVSIHLSKSRFFLDSSSDFANMEDADVVLTSEGHTELLKHTGYGIYTADYNIKTGDRVEIKATVAGFPSVSAIASIPQRPQVGEMSTEKSSAEYELQGWSNTGLVNIGVAEYQDIKFKIPLTDVGNEKNYYRLVVLKAEHYSENIQYSYLTYFTDAVFNADTSDDFFGMEGESNGYNIFSDVLFNGSTYNLNFNDYNLREVRLLPEYDEFEYGYSIPNQVVYHIEVQQLSYEYFMYLKTRNAFRLNDGNPFMEPIQIFSNVENGTGILGGVAVSERVVVVE